MLSRVKWGTASLEGLPQYSIAAIDLQPTGLSVENRDPDNISRQLEKGPHFSFDAITGPLLRSLLFAHLEYKLSLPGRYRFNGPVLGYARESSGYDAAANGGNQRPILRISLDVELNSEGLLFDIQGIAGFIIERDCKTPTEQFTQKNYALKFLIPIEEVPNVIDVRTATNIFENRYLSHAHEQRIVLPR